MQEIADRSLSIIDNVSIQQVQATMQKIAQWKRIDLYPDYLISPKGDIYSLKKRRLLKQKIQSNGYYAVCVFDKYGKEKTVLVHRLVAMAYIPNPENKPQINHIDGNKQNNHVSNLEWVTGSENQKHAYRNGLNKFDEVDWENLKKLHEKRKKPVVKIDRFTNKILAKYESIKEAGEKNSIDYKQIHATCKGKQPTAHGFKWAYEEDVING